MCYSHGGTETDRNDLDDDADEDQGRADSLPVQSGLGLVRGKFPPAVAG
jgi:hypothetical protein